MILKTNKKLSIEPRTPTKDEYVGAVYGSAALVAVAEAVMLDAFDEMEERTDYPTRRAVHDHMKAAEILMHDTLLTIYRELKRKEDEAWMADFGNAVRETVAVGIERMRYAIANVLGRCKGLQSPSSVALMLVAQSIAAEAAGFAERRAELFRSYYTQNRHGSMVSASNVIRGFSCRMAEQRLRRLARTLIEPVATDGLDLLADRDVRNGVKILIGKLGNVETWKFARDKANKLNGRKEKEQC